MKLKEYLKENGISATFLGSKIGATRSQVSLWCSGKNIPRKETMLIIEKFTKGKVKPQDWFTE